MFWLLLGLVLLVCLLLLAATLLTLWRRVKVLGGAVTQMGGAVEGASAQIEALRSGPLGQQPCPTCGAPAAAATKKPPRVRA